MEEDLPDRGRFSRALRSDASKERLARLDTGVSILEGCVSGMVSIRYRRTSDPGSCLTAGSLILSPSHISDRGFFLATRGKIRRRSIAPCLVLMPEGVVVLPACLRQASERC